MKTGWRAAEDNVYPVRIERVNDAGELLQENSVIDYSRAG